MDWSLLACGQSGHVTYAPAEPALRRRLTARAESGEQAWRCLRCGSFVAGEPQSSGPAAQAPVPRRDKEVRSALILRVFAVERWLRALVVAVLAFVVWRFEYARESIEQAYQRELPLLRSLTQQLGFNIDHSKLVGLFNRALNLSPATIRLVAILLACYAVIEIVEGIGLWQARRWGEYFAMVATSLGLPYEIYDLVTKFGITAFGLFLINLALVLYLVITKRLFGARGGKKAYDARLRSESLMEAAIEAAAAGEHAAAAGEHAAAPTRPAQADPPPQPSAAQAPAVPNAPAARAKTAD
jgi:uncharacterized membrane protein (DUF2068 family)